MNVKSLVPAVLVLVLVGATGYMAGNKGLPGSDKTKGLLLMEDAHASDLSSSTKASTKDETDIKQKILANVKGLDEAIQDIQIEETPVAGVYWVLLPGNETVLVSEDGKYVLGRSINEFKNGTLQPVQSDVVELALKSAQEAVKNDFVSSAETQLVYPAKGEKKSEIYVFTDVNCGYCRKFHKEIPELNQAGIEVRYFAGPFFSKDRASLEKIWCSEDPIAAMDTTKNGRSAPDSVISPECIATVSEHMAIGQRLGIRGTPAVFTKEGDKLGGYLPASELIKRLTQG